jgi:hypothetical protein
VVRSLLTAAAALVAVTFPRVAGAAAPLVTLSIPEVGVVVGSGDAMGPGVPLTPNCLGPRSVVHPRVTAMNAGTTPTNLSATITLDPGLAALADSCSADVGTCTVDNASKVTWTATLRPGQTGSIVFAAEVAVGTPINTKLCVTLSLSFDGGPPNILKACATTNSADECGLGAPVLGTSGRALLIALLALVGARLVAGRTARRNG